MAIRRCFSIELLKSDAYTDLPLKAQALYLQLCLSADDEGFCDQVKTCYFYSKAKAKELDVLAQSGFIITFPRSNVVVITDWRRHNVLRAGRAKMTIHLAEREKIYVQENDSYTLDAHKGTPLAVQTAGKRPPTGSQTAAERQPNGVQVGGEKPANISNLSNLIKSNKLKEAAGSQPTASGTTDDDGKSDLTFIKKIKKGE